MNKIEELFFNEFRRLNLKAWSPNSYLTFFDALRHDYSVTQEDIDNEIKKLLSEGLLHIKEGSGKCPIYLLSTDLINELGIE